MDQNVKAAIFRKFAAEPFALKLGMQLLSLEEGYAQVGMLFTDGLENMFGMAHGGAIFSLIDAAFEVASNSHGTMAVALNMNIHYLASPAWGAKLTAEAREIKKTNKTAVYDIRAVDDAERLLAVCQALVYRLDKPLPFLEK